MKILGKPIGQWEEEFPIVRDLIDLKETLWINPKKLPIDEAVAESSVTMEDVLDASARLERFAPYLALAFPETAKTGGIIIIPIPLRRRSMAYSVIKMAVLASKPINMMAPV